MFRNPEKRSVCTVQACRLCLVLALCFCSQPAAATGTLVPGLHEGLGHDALVSSQRSRVNFDLESLAAAAHKQPAQPEGSWGYRLAGHLTQGLAGLSMPAAPRRILAAITNSSCQPSFFSV